MNNKVFIELKDTKNCPSGANKTIYYDDEIDYSDNYILCNRCKLRTNCQYFEERTIKSISIREVEKRLKSLKGKQLNKQDLLGKLYGAFEGYLTNGGQSNISHSFLQYTDGEKHISLIIVDRDDRDYIIGVSSDDDEAFTVTYVERH